MDSKGSQIGVVQPTRRSTRQKKVNELTPREPLKRSRRETENRVPATAVNGSKDDDDTSEDEESPSKKSKQEARGAEGGRGDAFEMDVQETEEDLEKNGDQEMIEDHSTQQRKMMEEDRSTQQRSFGKPLIGNMNVPTTVGVKSLEPPELGALRSRRSIHPVTGRDAEAKRGRVGPSSRAPVASTRSENRPDVVRSSTMAEYREKMEAKAKSTGNPRTNHSGTTSYPTPKGSYKAASAQFHQTIPPKNQGSNKCAVTRRTSASSSIGGKKSATKGSFGSSYKGCILGFVLVLVVAALGFLAHPHYSEALWPAGGGRHASSEAPGEFVAQLSAVETQFPSQRPELWRRSRIHLERHLQTAQPTEPVSLILTAGRGAERTLHCLARHLASSFSTALNASVLHIDGASKAQQDSDQVKLDIDSQLRGAFEGDQPVAVIHRFEELPPGSTLIFYRYCDHENAAYKKSSLIFTVLLGEEEDLPVRLSLKAVEEMVDDHLQRKFLSSDHPTAFDRMDLDKYSGLWSRISHLVLPVAAEKRMEEEGGC